MRLRPAHESFLKEFISNGGNATQAYLKAFPRAKYSSARHSASILLTNVYIKHRALEVFEESGIGLKAVAKKLCDLMNAKTNHYFVDQNGTTIFRDDKDAQFKALNIILRLYEALFKSGTGFMPEQLEQLEKLQEPIVEEE